jgi:hypothetical protein
MSNRSIPRKPSVKAKPPSLRGPSLGRPEEDWLNENLLADGDDVSSPTQISADFPRQLGSHDQGLYDSHDQEFYDSHDQGPYDSHDQRPDGSHDQRLDDSRDQRPYRLVIAIDYGTTFTGEQSLIAIFGAS